MGGALRIFVLVMLYTPDESEDCQSCECYRKGHDNVEGFHIEFAFLIHAMNRTFKEDSGMINAAVKGCIKFKSASVTAMRL